MSRRERATAATPTMCPSPTPTEGDCAHPVKMVRTVSRQALITGTPNTALEKYVLGMTVADLKAADGTYWHGVVALVVVGLLTILWDMCFRAAVNEYLLQPANSTTTTSVFASSGMTQFCMDSAWLAVYTVVGVEGLGHWSFQVTGNSPKSWFIHMVKRGADIGAHLAVWLVAGSAEGFVLPAVIHQVMFVWHVAKLFHQQFRFVRITNVVDASSYALTCVWYFQPAGAGLSILLYCYIRMRDGCF
eukprot:GFYU01013375.1.p1 GENE.GFYU01013375.1~~GFYU01013375.1.p1  ORF type:complete len:246 (+),score=47.73 GFYU01013375.1:553-1290(+)